LNFKQNNIGNLKKSNNIVSGHARAYN